MVGERGAGLSGGERQRVAIARALIKDAPLILLDEATASLNSESEHHVQKAVAEFCKGRTTIVIAHRLSTVMHADKILVIEAGRVAKSGRHDELLRKGGRYALFYRLQLQQQEALRSRCVARRVKERHTTLIFGDYAGSAPPHRTALAARQPTRQQPSPPSNGAPCDIHNRHLATSSFVKSHNCSGHKSRR